MSGQAQMQESLDVPEDDANHEALEEINLSEDEQLDAAWERATGNQTEAVPDEEEAPPAAEADAKDAVEEPKEKAEQKAEIDKPTIFQNLPAAVRDAWEELAPDVRDSIDESYGQMQARSVEAGRLMKGIGPIRDAIVQATRYLPELADMTPEQVAADVAELAKTRAQLMRDPVDTLFRTAQAIGATDGLKQALGVEVGEGGKRSQADHQLITQMQNEMSQMRQAVQQISNPDIIRGTVSGVVQEQQTAAEVQQWANTKPHYAQVEGVLPGYIQAVKQTAAPGTPNRDILEAAYQMATTQMGLQQVEAQTAAEAPVRPAPTRPEAALKATSINVKSRGTKPAEMDEDQALDAAWERAMQQ